MKTRKSTLIICILVTLALLVSCGAATPEATVDGYLKACINLDSAKMNEYFPSNDAAEISTDGDNFTNLMKRLKYKINGSEVSGDTATVEVTITALDMKTIMGEIVSDLLGQAFTHIGDEDFDSEAYMNELLSEKMSAEDAPTVTNDVTVNLEKDASGKWIISSEEKNIDFLNALTGDLMSIADSFGVND